MYLLVPRVSLATAEQPDSVAAQKGRSAWLGEDWNAAGGKLCRGQILLVDIGIMENQDLPTNLGSIEREKRASQSGRIEWEFKSEEA